MYPLRKGMGRLAALLGAGLLLAGCFGGAPVRQAGVSGSNGHGIYFTATSQRGTPITSTGGPELAGGMMGGRPQAGVMGGRLACVSCHGQAGRGGQVQMTMLSFTAPDIRFKMLTSPTGQEQGASPPPYTDATIRRAITEGTDPAGESLKAPMPRWQMSAEDLDDLVAFLKTLS